NDKLYGRGMIFNVLMDDSRFDETNDYFSNNNQIDENAIEKLTVIQFDKIPAQVSSTENGTFFVLTNDGEVYAFGLIISGVTDQSYRYLIELKENGYTYNQFTLIRGLNQVIQITSEDNISLFLENDGTVYETVLGTI